MSLCALLAAAPVLAQDAAKDAAKAAPASADKPAAADPDKVLARIDGEPVTQRDLDIAAEDLGDRLPRVTEEKKRDYLIGYVIDLKIGAKAAEAAGAASAPDFAKRVAYFRDKVLLDEYLSRAAKAAVTPEAARKLYEDTVKDLKPEPEVHARHILVETEDEAKKVYERVTKGKEDFAKVASEVSKDPGSGKEGGDLGFFTKERMVKEFAEAAFKMEPGQISQPVKTQFGWHVIKVEEKRTKPLPAFDDVKDEIDNFLARKAQQDAVLALRAKAKIERLDTPAPGAAGKDGTKDGANSAPDVKDAPAKDAPAKDAPAKAK
jgi:peptidyl-prolyl cis-trans isomerase C